LSIRSFDTFLGGIEDISRGFLINCPHPF